MAIPDIKPRQVANDFHIYSRLFHYVRRYWPALLIAIFASMIYSGVDAWFVYFLKPLLNKGLVAKNRSFLANAPMLVMGVFILRGIANFFSSYCVSFASRGVIMRLRQDLFAHLQHLPARYYDRTSSGQVLSVLLYAVDQVANASADVLTTAIQSLFLIVGLVIVMFSVSWKITLMYFVVLPMVTVIMRMASLRIRRLSLSIQDSVAELSHCAEENIEGYKVVRTFEGQDYEIQKFNLAAFTNMQREMKVVIARSVSVSMVAVITAAALSLTLYIATLDIADSLLSPGGFVAMVAAMLMLLKPLKDLAFVQNKLYRGLAGAQTVFELLDEPVEEDKGIVPITTSRGHIEFVNVNFSYDERKHVLCDISFTVRPGEVIALVGRSGSGKSTLVGLLNRLYDNFTGDILLDGVSIRNYPLKDLRRQFALVSQNITLFHDTVANNIAYGRFDKVTLEEITAAAHAAYAMEFIDKLPDRMDSRVGENAVLLSGGQRQRIAIARAILKNSPILILDEATSALDTESERYIQIALEELKKNRTTLVIAHRLSTIEHADKIIMMDEGRIIEMGSHQQLLALNGHYARLYHMQFKEVPPSLMHEAARNEALTNAIQ